MSKINAETIAKWVEKNANNYCREREPRSLAKRCDCFNNHTLGAKLLTPALLGAVEALSSICDDVNATYESRTEARNVLAAISEMVGV